MDEIDQMGKNTDYFFSFKWVEASSEKLEGYIDASKGSDGKTVVTLNYIWGDEANKAHEVKHGFQVMTGLLIPQYPAGSNKTDIMMPKDRTVRNYYKSEVQAYQRQYHYQRVLPTASKSVDVWYQ